MKKQIGGMSILFIGMVWMIFDSVSPRKVELIPAERYISVKVSNNFDVFLRDEKPSPG